MENTLEFKVKIKSFTWKNYLLVLGEKEFQLINPNNKSKKPLKYDLVGAVVLDKSEKNDLKILISSPIYRFLIKILSLEDKQTLLSKLEEIIKKNSAKTAFSQDYLKHLQEISNLEEKNPFDSILSKLNTYKVEIIKPFF